MRARALVVDVRAVASTRTCQANLSKMHQSTLVIPQLIHQLMGKSGWAKADQAAQARLDSQLGSSGIGIGDGRAAMGAGPKMRKPSTRKHSMMPTKSPLLHEDDMMHGMLSRNLNNLWT